MTEEKTLQTELNFYEKHKDEYIKHYRGQFLLIKGEIFVKSFATEAEAYRAGLEKFGNEPFLIKLVAEAENSASYPALTVGVIHMNV